MQPHERLAFSAIETRPPLKLPDGLRLILWPLMSLEQWDISRPMARMVITPPQGQPMLPDHPNWSWHEYGMRVGFWRLKKRVRAAEDDADRHRQRPRLRGLSAGDPGGRRRRLGAERPRLRPDPDAQGRGPARLDQEGHRHRRQVLGPAAARLVRAGPDADLRHARLSVAGRHRIYRRLGARRRAGDLEDHAQAGGRPALQFRAA